MASATIESVLQEDRLFPPSPDAGTAGDVARRIRDAVRQPQVIAGIAVEVDASIGVARAPVDGRDLESLLRRADVAMYGAKHSGGGDRGCARLRLGIGRRDAERLGRRL